jgi:hypothetical protein
VGASLGLSPVALRTLWGTHPGNTRACLVSPCKPGAVRGADIFSPGLSGGAPATRSEPGGGRRRECPAQPVAVIRGGPFPSHASRSLRRLTPGHTRPSLLQPRIGDGGGGPSVAWSSGGLARLADRVDAGSIVEGGQRGQRPARPATRREPPPFPIQKKADDEAS